MGTVSWGWQLDFSLGSFSLHHYGSSAPCGLGNSRWIKTASYSSYSSVQSTQACPASPESVEVPCLALEPALARSHQSSRHHLLELSAAGSLQERLLSWDHCLVLCPVHSDLPNLSRKHGVLCLALKPALARSDQSSRHCLLESAKAGSQTVRTAAAGWHVHRCLGTLLGTRDFPWTGMGRVGVGVGVRATSFRGVSPG